ncbi:MAG TPA: hypothetical protein VMY88_11775, partial [Acidimicrobiales bacterium]|nr:hypothetical protein [Acidimicrobiales bacterium]
LVLGMPLAVASPLVRAPQAGNPGSELASSAPEPMASVEETLEGYEAATPTIPLPDFDSIDIRESEPANGATPVTTIVNDPRCGAGFTSSALAGQDFFACFHNALDPLPDLEVNRAQAASKAPVCLGNGVNGPRIQLIYMYVEGQPNRAAQVVPRIVNEFVPRMEGMFRETSKFQGREIGMRLHMPGCKLQVDTVQISEANGEPDDPFAMAGRITNRLVEAGYDSSDRKYITWFDGGNKGACGIAPSYTALVGEVTDNAVTGNISNVGWQPVMIAGETAIIFRWGFPLLGEPAPQYPGAPPPPECWGRGGSGARTELHELTHNLGAVNLSAPNSNGFGHCTDDHDLMCYGERGVSTVPRCATPVEQLDCGSDDYFNARPSAGSYLSTHWNTANSRFLGEAIVHDAVPVEIPRP